MAENSFFPELFRRRVPQILGLYVAATWMAIEIGDWMTERFALPDTLTAYIFIGLLALLPTIGVLAWGHGAPGRDRWTRFQVGFMGLNAVLAGLAAITYVTPQAVDSPALAAATETVTLVDDAGNTETYEVAKSGFHQSLMAFFFSNDTGNPEFDWLSYATPWAMAEDLNRNPLISVATPFAAQTVIERMRATGHPTAVGEPLSLDLQIARSRGLRQIITGSIASLADGALQLTANLIDVETGQPLAKWSESGGDWLDSADQLSGKLRSGLLDTLAGDTIVTELTIKEHTSDNEEAVRLLVEALRLRAFDNDYPGAIATAEQSVGEDPTLAMGFVVLSQLHRLTGDVTKALDNARKALALDYKLYSETRFAMKANEQAIMGNLPQAIRMLERWAQIHPESAQVQEALGENYMLVNRVDDSQQAFARLLELEPGQKKTLLSLAQTYRMQGNADRAIELIREYLEGNKQDADALIRLGKTYIQQGQFEDAREAFDEAAFVGSDPTSAQLAQVKLLLREGRSDQAQAALETLRARSMDDRQAYQVSAIQYLHFTNAGQIRNSLAELERQKLLVQSFLPPILQVFQVDNQVAVQMAALGDREGALAKARALRESMQPPFDSLTLIAVMEIHSAFDDAEDLEQNLVEVEQFLKRYQFPFLEPITKSYRAELLTMRGEFDSALKLHDEVLANLTQSYIMLEEPLVVDQSKLKKAQALRKARRLEDGVALIYDILKLNPGLAVARLELVELLAAQGYTSAALAEAAELGKLWANADPEYREKKRFDALLLQLNAG